MSITVAIVEDDPRFAEGLKYFLSKAPDVVCVAVCPSAEDALQRLPVLRPQVVLMDINLPGVSGVVCVRDLKALLPDTQIAMLTIFDDYERISQSLFAGASSYFLKSIPPTELLDAIREVHAGGSPMSSAIARKVVSLFRKFDPGQPKTEALTPREQEVLSALAEGCLYKEIAVELSISYDTVRTHIQNIYKKLHVRTRAQAVKQFHSSP